MRRCRGITKAGKRCKINVNLSPEGFCKYHQFQIKSEDVRKKYERYMKSPEWKLKREIVLSVLGETCKLCGRPAKSIHHNNYDRLYEEDLLKDLTVLCNGCHKNFHKKR